MIGLNEGGVWSGTYAPLQRSLSLEAEVGPCSNRTDEEFCGEEAGDARVLVRSPDLGLTSPRSALGSSSPRSVSSAPEKIRESFESSVQARSLVVLEAEPPADAEEKK